MHLKQSSKVDIHAVARSAGVSISTVSRSFNHPNLVNASTAKKIDRAVRKLGYIRNRAAQTMHGMRSGTVGVIVPTIDHAIFGEVVQAFADHLDNAGLTLLMATHGFDLKREYQVLRKLLEHRVDGIALIGLEHSEETFALLDEQQIPAVAMWNYDAESRISCVGADNVACGRMAARQLLDSGHRRIATVFPEAQGNDRARGRWQGAREVLDAAGVAIPDHWQPMAPYRVDEAKRVCQDILAHADRPTAFLCGNDVIAQGAIYAAHSAGLSVPDQLSVVGIGDFKGSAEIEPGLSTIRIPARQIGTLAGQTLLGLVRKDLDGIQRHKCDLRLVTRRSIGVTSA